MHKKGIKLKDKSEEDSDINMLLEMDNLFFHHEYQQEFELNNSSDVLRQKNIPDYLSQSLEFS